VGSILVHKGRFHLVWNCWQLHALTFPSTIRMTTSSCKKFNLVHYTVFHMRGWGLGYIDYITRQMIIIVEGEPDVHGAAQHAKREGGVYEHP